MTKYISEYILRSEYECSHCHALPPDIQWNLDHLKPELPYMYAELFEMFGNLRKEWGRAIPINSGYRCPDYNKQLVSAGYASPLSVHVFGLAIDCECKDVKEVTDMSNLLEELHPELRMGVYKDTATFIHIDNGFVITPRASKKWIEGNRWYG